MNNGLVATTRTPAVDWDGIHIWIRYLAEDNLYAVSVNRRDDVILIKKKVPGGTTNGGTYYTISKTVTRAVSYGVWESFKVTAKNLPGGAVKIELWDNHTGALLLSVVDDGSIGGPAITKAGRIGVRGDNCNFYIGGIIVKSL